MAAIPFPEHCDSVDIDGPATDVPAFESGPAHAGPNPFDDQVAFELRDRADDDDDGPSERATGIEVFPEADVLDVQVVEFVQDFEEVPDGSSDPVRCPDEHHLEPAAARLPKQFVETRPLSLRAGDPVGIFGDDLEAALV